MAAEFKVDLDHLDQIVIKLAGLAGFVADHLDVIDDKVAELVGTGWEGVAAEAYRVAHAQWVTGAREFAEGIRDRALRLMPRTATTPPRSMSMPACLAVVADVPTGG
ncbi:WXG100 family type VII secretion target [Nocardia rhizosphaerihabitans]|uniref:WXG100 family type VII secretion target n=1 Tax=Nocardia rhizosphaerihabitans TaxID=1691570 RepID=UPI003671B0D2